MFPVSAPPVTSIRAGANNLTDLMGGPVLVTGATGLIGSVVCRMLLEEGDPVRALVRRGSDTGPLEAARVQLAEGNVTPVDDVVAAADGCTAIINSAAGLGGNAQQLDEQRSTNVGGAGNVYEAGARHGVRVVSLSTTTFFRHDPPLTEESPPTTETSDDPYTVTKAAAYADAMRRTDAGQDIVIVVPGGTFGAGLSLARTMAPTSYTRLLRGAINNKVAEYVRYPVPWVWVDDVAACTIAALRRGVAGRKYLAFGAEDAQSTAAFLNVGCAAAGVDQRVADVTIDPGDPSVVARYGPSLVSLSQRRFPVPFF